MSFGLEPKEYGPHKYAGHDGTSDCANNCGCWMGPSRSGGPIGLDPGGLCPGNPLDGARRPGNTDYHDVVNQRIEKLGRRAYAAEEKLKSVEPGTVLLAQQLMMKKRELLEYEQLVGKLKALLK